MTTDEGNSGRKKRNIGWDHGKLVDPNNKDKGVRCNYCSHITHGGITRHKQHLAGGYKNSSGCQKAPSHVKDEFKELLKSKEEAKRAGYYPETDDCDMNELEGSDVEMISNTHGKRHMSSSHSQPKKSKQRGPIDWYFQADVEAKEKKKSGKEALKYRNSQKKLRDIACTKIARWMYDAGISFNAVTYESFKDMIDGVGDYGPGMKPLSYYEVRVTYLKEVENTRDLIKSHEEEILKTGCTLMCDGWTDRKNQSIINFLVNTAKGTMYLDSVDASGVSHTADYIFGLLKKYIEDIGPKMFYM